MLAGFLLLAGSFFVFTLLADHIENDVVRWFAGVVSLAVGLWLAYALNAAIVARIDPDGAQRAEIRSRESARRR
jgi:hypothetical protein